MNAEQVCNNFKSIEKAIRCFKLVLKGEQKNIGLYDITDNMITISSLYSELYKYLLEQIQSRIYFNSLLAFFDSSHRLNTDIHHQVKEEDDHIRKMYEEYVEKFFTNIQDMDECITRSKEYIEAITNSFAFVIPRDMV